MVWIALHGLLFLFLFSDFYKNKYTDKKAVKNGGACMVSRKRNSRKHCGVNFCLFYTAGFGRRRKTEANKEWNEWKSK